MTGVFRTPEERFEGLPDFAFEPNYRSVGDLRLAHLDVGEGPPVVMVHGEPAWSFIWRKVIPPVRDAGYRCVVPDHAGFGRSDKPVDPAWQSLERHVELTATLLEELDLNDVTLVLHDWGGPIGLTLALAHPGRVARTVILDTAIDPREVWMSEAWVRLRGFVERAEDVSVGELMRATCLHELADDVVAAYEAPFPVPESKGWRGLMMTIPRMDDDSAARSFEDRLIVRFPGATRALAARSMSLAPRSRLRRLLFHRTLVSPRAATVAAEGFYDALCADTRPMLVLWAESDLFLTLASGERLASRIGHGIDHVIPDAGHALQEDQGPMVGGLIAEWLLSTR